MTTINTKDVDRSLAEWGVTANTVLDRLAGELGVSKDVELAKVLGVATTTLSNWRKRNRIPYAELLALHFTRGIDFVFCLIGVSAGDLQAERLLREHLSEQEQRKTQEALSRGLAAIYGDDYSARKPTDPT